MFKIYGFFGRVYNRRADIDHDRYRGRIFLLAESVRDETTGSIVLAINYSGSCSFGLNVATEPIHMRLKLVFYNKGLLKGSLIRMELFKIQLGLGVS